MSPLSQPLRSWFIGNNRKRKKLLIVIHILLVEPLQTYVWCHGLDKTGQSVPLFQVSLCHILYLDARSLIICQQIFSILTLTCLVCSFLSKYLWAWQIVFYIVCSHTENVSCVWLQIRDYKLCIIPIIQQLCHRTRLSFPLTWKLIFYFSIEFLWLFPRNTNCCCVQSLGREILGCWRHWKNNMGKYEKK